MLIRYGDNYSDLVFNGDIGTIDDVDTEEKEIVVRFDNRLITYSITELDDGGVTLDFAPAPDTPEEAKHGSNQESSMSKTILQLKSLWNKEKESSVFELFQRAIFIKFR